MSVEFMYFLGSTFSMLIKMGSEGIKIESEGIKMESEGIKMESEG